MELKMDIEIINKEAEIAVAVKFEAVEFTKMAEIMVEGSQKLCAAPVASRFRFFSFNLNSPRN